MGVEREAEFVRDGANLIVHEADIITFRDNASKDLARLRQLLGEKAAPANKSGPNI